MGEHSAQVWRWTVALLTALLVLSQSASPAFAAAEAAPKVKSSASATVVKVKTAVTIAGSVSSTRTGTAVWLERQVGTTWKQLTKGKVKAGGAYAFTVKPSALGLWKLRVRTAKATGKPMNVTAVAKAFTVSLKPTTAFSFSAPYFYVKVAPAAPKLRVSLQRLMPDGSWRTVTSAPLRSDSGVLIQGPAGPGAGLAQYRLLAPASATVAAGMSPVRVPLTRKADLVAAGFGHTCVSGEGELACWGHNGNGQLGSAPTAGPESVSIDPVLVPSLPNPLKITLGWRFSCALFLGSVPQCWGENSVNQLGNGTQQDSAAPVDVTALQGRTRDISSGRDHSCAVVTPHQIPGESTTDGVMCWGSNASGQLGAQIAGPAPSPVYAIGGTAIAVAAGGTHSCVLLSHGAVECWGDNRQGQLGMDYPLPQSTYNPRPVAGLQSGVTAIAAGDYFTCALTSAGGVMCWGRGFDGTLGNNSVVDSFKPVQVEGLESGVTAISAGGYHACALKTDASLVCWGSNLDGQLGDGTTTSRLVPTPVTGLPPVTAVAAGTIHTCALTVPGPVYCWGNNDTGGLGRTTPRYDDLGQHVPQPNPTPVPAFPVVLADARQPALQLRELR
jgi:alpha-tubulin suppressor-like RCC1 family protein